MNVKVPDLDCPYVGLAPFEAAHANYFFGRTLDSAVIADNVLNRPIVVLHGASGVGKSSVLNVGLPQALGELASAPRIVSRREWHEPELLGPWLDSAISASQSMPGRPLILILDQFEEYFLYPGAEQMKRFAKSLAALVARTDIEVHLLFALRDDSLHRLDALRGHLPGLLDTTLELRHLDEGAVREAIERPIVEWNKSHRPGVVIDDDFAEALLAQLRPKDSAGHPIQGGRIELAYLQLALFRIWEAEGGREAKALRTSTLTERLRGIGEISRRHVEELLGKLPEADQALCATVFDRLVTPSGGKILYATKDLAAVAKVQPSRVDSVLAQLASGKYRLLRVVDLPAGKDAHGYEILHDVLARPILDWKDAWTTKRDAKAEKARAEAERVAKERELEQAKALAEAQQQRADQQAAATRKYQRFTLALGAVLLITALTVGIAVVQYWDRAALHGRLESMETQQATLVERRRVVEAELADLGKVRSALVADNEKASAELKELGLREKALTDERKRLQTFNTAMSAVVAANGSVRSLPSGGLEVRFGASTKPLLDTVRQLPALGRVEVLGLREAAVSEPLLRQVRGLASLRELDLSDTDVDDSGVEQLASLRALQSLRLDDTLISVRALDALAAMPALRSLNLSRTRVHAEALAALRGRRPTLAVIYEADPFLEALSANKGDWDVALALVGGHRRGGEVTFFNSGITNATLKVLGQFEALNFLYCNYLTNEGMRNLGRHKRLRKLTLTSDNQLTDSAIEHLTTLPALEILEMGSLALTDRAFNSIARMRSLRALRFNSGTGRYFSDAAVATLVQLPALESLAMNFTWEATDAALDHIAELRSLRELELLSAKRMTAEGFAKLATSSKLRRLDLGFNELADRDVPQLSRLRQLEWLGLRNTNFTPDGLARLRTALPSTRVDMNRLLETLRLTGETGLSSAGQPEGSEGKADVEDKSRLPSPVEREHPNQQR